MKTLRGNRVVVVMLAAAVGSAMVGRAEEPITSIQPEPGQKQLAMIQWDNDEADGGQQAQQKVMLEIAGAEARVVKGKPYSADTSTESVQTLADGNRIAHRTVSKFYRDSEGRTRREETFGNVDPEHPSPHEVKVFIDDPVSGTAFVLDPGSKTLEKLQRTRNFVDVPRADVHGAQIMLDLVKNDSETKGQAAPGKVFFNADHSSNPDDGVLAMVIADENRNIVKEDLGTRDIGGVDCTGTRQTSTIPAGAIGNDKPISIVTETWFSEAIGAVVESISDDPRYGKTTYQLTNLQLSEPPRSLFEPPANFKVNVPK
jgi:hypothetical protein